MEKKKQTKGGNVRAKNKKLVGLWVDLSVYDMLKKRADRDEHGNVSEVILRSIEAYLKNDLNK